MINTYIKASAACPKTNVADINFNIENIKKCICNACDQHSKIIVFPELCITSYTCGDLFEQDILIKKSIEAIKELANYILDRDILVIVGAPLLYNYCLYNCAYVLFKGNILGIVPKSYIPNYSEFYEKRWFTEGFNITDKVVNLDFQENVPFGTNLIFKCGDLRLGIEICEDLWVTIPPSSYLSLLGANVIVNLSASNEIVSKSDYRRNLVSNQSARCMCAYLYASSGVLESSTDLVFSGNLIISENGTILKENERFQRDNEVMTSIIDMEKLTSERLKNISFRDSVKLCPFEAQLIEFEYSDMIIGDFDRDLLILTLSYLQMKKNVI